MTRDQIIELLMAGQSKRDKVRLLSVQDVEDILSRATEVVKELPVGARTSVRLEHVPHEVANAYGARAWGTGVTCTFSGDGEPTDVKVSRVTVGNYQKSRLKVDTTTLSSSDIVVLKSAGMTSNHNINL
jgi:hypothetical protein